MEYDKNTWTISRTKIQSIYASHLDKEKTIEELQEKFKRELLSVASGLLMDAGFGGMKKGKLYSTMMNHIIKKIFNVFINIRVHSLSAI